MLSLKRFLIFLVLIISFISGCVDDELSKALKDRDYDTAINILKVRVEREGETGEYAFYYSFLLGKTYFDKGEYDEAIKYLIRAKNVYKKGMYVFSLDYGVDFWIGRSYLEIGQYKEAIEYLKKAESIAPIDLKTIAIYPEYAKQFEENYSKYIPTKDICYKWLITAYTNSGQYQNAIEAFNKAMELKPEVGSLDVVHLANVSFAYSQVKQYDNALLTAKKAIESNKISPIGYFSLAMVYSEMRDYDNAIVYLKRAEQLNPNNPNLLYNLAVTYIFKNNLEEAMNYLNKTISLKTFTGIGTRIEMLDNFPIVKELLEGPAKKEGIEVGDKIIKINGKSTKGSSNKEIIKALRGELGTQVILTIQRKNLENPIDKSIIRETIIDRSAASDLALRSLVNVLMQRNIGEAEKDAKLAYSLNSDGEYVKEALATIYIEQGKYDETIRILSNTSKENFLARLLEATAYARKSDYKKAVEIYSSIPEKFFTSRFIFSQNFLNTFFESMKPYVSIKKATAKSFEVRGQYREALNEYIEVLKFTDEKEAKEIRSQIAVLIKKNPYLSEIPEEARRYALGGETLLKDGKLKEALQEYLKAVKVAPHIAIFYRTLALINGELKDYTNAVRNMNIYLELMPDAPDARAVKDQIYKWEFMLEREKGGKR